MRAGRPWKAMRSLRHVEPVVEMRIVGDQLLHALIGLVDVFRIAGERGPAEGPDAAAEQRADIGRNEARKSEGVLEAHVEGHLADVVAVVEGRHAGLVEIEHRLRHALRIDAIGGGFDRLGIG